MGVLVGCVKVREPYLVTTHSRVEERVFGASNLLGAVKDVLGETRVCGAAPASVFSGFTFSLPHHPSWQIPPSGPNAKGRASSF
jgi:hypothetical protein